MGFNVENAERIHSDEKKTIRWQKEDLYFQITKSVRVHEGEHVNCQRELLANIIN